MRRRIDNGINMGIYSYPVLMAADILLFSAEQVPVGADQIQHIEITRDIAIKFNKEYKQILTLPEALITQTKDIPGIDGQKMSKSYNNIIPLFSNINERRKQIMKIKTDSLPITAKKDKDKCILYELKKK